MVATRWATSLGMGRAERIVLLRGRICRRDRAAPHLRTEGRPWSWPQGSTDLQEGLRTSTSSKRGEGLCSLTRDPARLEPARSHPYEAFIVSSKSSTQSFSPTPTRITRGSPSEPGPIWRLRSGSTKQTNMRRFQETWVSPMDTSAPTCSMDSSTRRWFRSGGEALFDAGTGAMIAAPTTSLPETPGGERNWDYRFSWIRDSSLIVRALDGLGFRREADGFRRFVERSAAGSALELQVLYGIGGERRLPEIEIEGLAGFGGARPVRKRNRAAEQFQLDIFGELLDVAWEWHRRGTSPDPDYIRFLAGIADRVVDVWRHADHGIWEVRDRSRQFVHSKAMCWVALDRAIKLSSSSVSATSIKRWRVAGNEIRSLIETDGCDPHEGTFRREIGADGLDAAALLLPMFGFVEYTDPRMVRTADAIRRELGEGGLIRRYRAEDGVRGEEGVFVACSFWLASCYGQGRISEADDLFERASGASNDLGLFSRRSTRRPARCSGTSPRPSPTSPTSTRRSR